MKYGKVVGSQAGTWFEPHSFTRLTLRSCSYLGFVGDGPSTALPLRLSRPDLCHSLRCFLLRTCSRTSCAGKNFHCPQHSFWYRKASKAYTVVVAPELIDVAAVLMPWFLLWFPLLSQQQLTEIRLKSRNPSHSPHRCTCPGVFQPRLRRPANSHVHASKKDATSAVGR